MIERLSTFIAEVLTSIFIKLNLLIQARLDIKKLGADEGEHATDAIIDAMEAGQDAVDSIDRAGAAGVLKRLRRDDKWSVS